MGKICVVDKSHSSYTEKKTNQINEFEFFFFILPSCLIDDVLPSPGDEAEFEFVGRWCITDTVVPFPSQWKSIESARTWALLRGWRSFCTA